MRLWACIAKLYVECGNCVNNIWVISIKFHFRFIFVINRKLTSFIKVWIQKKEVISQVRIESHSFDCKAECKSVHIHEIMHSCYLIALLLVFWFQSVCGNQNAALDKNYSDRLTETNNQQSSLQPNNEANHATVSSASNQFIASATDPSHETSHVNALETNIYYEIFMPFFYLHFFFAINAIFLIWNY